MAAQITPSSVNNFSYPSRAVQWTLNALGDKDKLTVSIYSGAKVTAFRRDVIEYNLANNYRTWSLVGYNTHFEQTDAVYVHLALSKEGDVATFVYPYTRLDIYGRAISDDGTKLIVGGVEYTLTKVEVPVSSESSGSSESGASGSGEGASGSSEGASGSGESGASGSEGEGGSESETPQTVTVEKWLDASGNEATVPDESTECYYLFVGKLTHSVGQNRAWESGYPLNGNLDTDQYRNEENVGDFDKMFRLDKNNNTIIQLLPFIKILLGLDKKEIEDLWRSTDVATSISGSESSGSEGSGSEGEGSESGEGSGESSGSASGGTSTPAANVDKDKVIPSIAYLEKYGVENFLSKIHDDTAKGLITFLAGLKSDSIESHSVPFQENLLTGTGFKFWIKDGRSYGEIDNLNVRRTAWFNKLGIREMDAISGDWVQSRAASEVKSVLVYTDEYGHLRIRCYYKKDEDKTSTTNTWMRGMQAMSTDFNIEPGTGEHTQMPDGLGDGTVYENIGNHYYWRLVVDISGDARSRVLPEDAQYNECGWVEFMCDPDFMEDGVLMTYDETGAKVRSLFMHDQDTANDNPRCLPAPNDKLICFGYRLGGGYNYDPETGKDFDTETPDDARNLTCVQILRSSKGAPEISQYQGIGAVVRDPQTLAVLPEMFWSFDDESHHVVQISPLGVNFNAKYFHFVAAGGFQFDVTPTVQPWAPQNVDGVVSNPHCIFGWQYSYMDCIFLVTNPDGTDVCPISFSDTGQAVVSDDWKLLAGVLPTLSMKMYDTVNLCDVNEVSVSMGVTRTLRCRLWLNLLSEMDVAPRSEAVAVTVDGQSHQGRRVRNMPDGWYLLDDTWEVTRDSGNASDDAAWHTAHNSGADRFAGEITLLFGVSDGSGVVNDLNRTGDGETVFTFSVVLTDGAERYEFENAVAF